MNGDTLRCSLSGRSRGFAVVLVAAVSALAVTPAAPRKVQAARTAACYERPEKGLLPSRYIDKNASAEVDSLLVDSLDAAWYRLSGGGWVSATDVRLIDEGNSGDSLSRSIGTDADKKRRIGVLREHPEWPRRVVRAVRSGAVCLDMTRDQLIASWGEPVQKSAGFMLGVGNHEIWFFRGTRGETLAVSLAEGRVIGWSGGNAP